MEVYFVRHGQTAGNVAKRHQAEHTPLTPLGREQAKAAASLIKKIKPTQLITSTNVRAIETASIIADECGLTAETNSLFVELRRPKHLHGQLQRSWQSIKVYMLWYFKKVMPGEVEIHGESYPEFRNRLMNAKSFLSSLPPDGRVVVVSHAVFINFFIAHLERSKPLTPLQALMVFYKVLTIKNASVTKVVL